MENQLNDENVLDLIREYLSKSTNKSIIQSITQECLTHHLITVEDISQTVLYAKVIKASQHIQHINVFGGVKSFAEDLIPMVPMPFSRLNSDRIINVIDINSMNQGVQINSERLNGYRPQHMYIDEATEFMDSQMLNSLINDEPISRGSNKTKPRKKRK